MLSALSNPRPRDGFKKCDGLGSRADHNPYSKVTAVLSAVDKFIGTLVLKLLAGSRTPSADIYQAACTLAYPFAPQTLLLPTGYVLRTVLR